MRSTYSARSGAGSPRGKSGVDSLYVLPILPLNAGSGLGRMAPDWTAVGVDAFGEPPFGGSPACAQAMDPTSSVAPSIARVLPRRFIVSLLSSASLARRAVRSRHGVEVRPADVPGEVEVGPRQHARSRGRRTRELLLGEHSIREPTGQDRSQEQSHRDEDRSPSHGVLFQARTPEYASVLCWPAWATSRAMTCRTTVPPGWTAE